MKKQLSIVALALAATGAAYAQQAASPFYGELGYTAVKFKEEGIKLDLGMVRGIVGYEFHPNVAVEGMLAFGVSDDSITENVSGVPVSLKAEIKNAYGIFVKPKFNVSDSLELFGRIGYTHFKTKATASAPGFGSVSATDSDSDLAYGLGAKYNFSKSSFATIDYMNYYSKDGVKGTGLTIGVGYRF